MPLIPDSPVQHPLFTESVTREPPARRLGILYISSLTAIAILSGVSVEFAVREMNWQGNILRAMSQSTDGEVSSPSIGS